ncbi:membrane-anchored ubiquitin-fold protein 3-like [Tripterygium wilfordii]|uniref:Membrane-anchored ubiquitin-fold protein 3-like n=1 Tax=Tripterygium wilfordii TaxID=458696 RepID=A0A7J7CFQ0_TRIWF|nr:membrane-anchored ubiquitin-fold protein 3-like [Tripterygium wilfordii]KAF5732697.1 membrane-anchored ubiquitin-fold protein 3-like [Tripterygium wilfordii]
MGSTRRRVTVAEEEENIDLEKGENVEIRFRITDGVDIGPGGYASSLTVEALKQQLVALWPEGTPRTPNSGNDLNLVYNGKIMENGMTVADCIKTCVRLPDGVITMHVTVRTPAAEIERDRRELELLRLERCNCNII